MGSHRRASARGAVKRTSCAVDRSRRPLRRRAVDPQRPTISAIWNSGRRASTDGRTDGRTHVPPLIDHRVDPTYHRRHGHALISSAHLITATPAAAVATSTLCVAAAPRAAVSRAAGRQLIEMTPPCHCTPTPIGR